MPTNKTLQKVVIVGYREDPFIDVRCPHCDNWEAQPIDQTRTDLKTFEIIDWLDVSVNEVSIMHCKVCDGQFKMEWNYNNEDFID